MANELGVSISTVSKALHDNKLISKENRELIQAFAKAHNYRPNNIALNLKNNSSKTIGVIIPEIVHYYFSKVITGIEKVANSKGYNVIIGVSNESLDKEIINTQLLVEGGVDGLIVSVTKETFLMQEYHHIKETINGGIPIVMFDRVIDGLKCDRVVIDDRDGSRKAVELLMRIGCQKILIITTEDYINIGRLRTEGYRDALRNHNLTVDEDLILKIKDLGQSEYGPEGFDEVVREKFQRHPDIDGVFAVNEIYAVKAIDVVLEMGFTVPDQISFVSFSDGILSKYSRPKLTTINQQGNQMGELAAEILIDTIESEEEKEEFDTYMVKSDIIVRDSTKEPITL